MSLKKISKSIRTRLILRIVLFLTLSLVIVSTVIYFLFAKSLRKNDHNLIRNLGQTYQKLYQEDGPSFLNERVDPEIMFVIKDNTGNIKFEHWPTHIDYDFEDEQEIEQVKAATNSLPKKKGWHNVLLRSGEEEMDMFENFEYQLRLLANKRGWQTILPMIDNDLFEIYMTKISDHEWMYIGKSSEEREEHLAKIRYISFMVIVPFLLMGLIFSFFLADNILRPIKKLAKTIQDIGQGATDVHAEIRGSGDEIDQLAEEFNTLHDKNLILVKNLKNTVDNVAHDLRTPLTRFRNSAEFALVKENDKEAMKMALEEAVESSAELLSLLNAIMDVTEAESNTLSLKLMPTTIDSVITSVIDLYSHVAEDKHVQIYYSTNGNLAINADFKRTIQAFGNIIDNAIKYSPENSKIEINTELKDNFVKILIRDEGPGIKLEDQPRIWERLYRGDSSRSTKGLGIGLSLVKAIIEAHKGHVELQSQAGVGSTFIISLPSCNIPVIEA